ncbi:uncharacterized protein LOC144639944 [Oculina patagonica]
MKTLAPTKRLSLSTLFLVSIMVAIVIAKETHQKGNSNPADVVDEYAVNKEVRQWRACYGGKCSRRRSGKRGMKMAQTQFENELQDFETNFDIPAAEAKTINNGKPRGQL